MNGAGGGVMDVFMFDVLLRNGEQAVKFLLLCIGWEEREGKLERNIDSLLPCRAIYSEPK